MSKLHLSVTSNLVALYARVSSEEQAKKESIKSQIAAAEEYCRANSLTLAHVFQDNGLSGSVPFEQRPGGKALLAAADRKEFSLVLVWKVSRLGRLDVVSHVARHALESRGIGLRSITEPFDTSTAAGQFMFSILAASASLERESIRQNTRAGLRRVAQAGSWASARAPYGYRIQDKKLVIDEAESQIVRRIFTEVAEGRRTANGLVKEFYQTGQMTREGKLWRAVQVSRLLHSPIYKGEYSWLDVRMPVPALVDAETWQRANDRLRKNQRFQPGSPIAKYPLRGLLYCACGRAMGGSTFKGPHRTHTYYLCTSRKEKRLGVSCEFRPVKAETLESLVLEQLRGLLDNRDLSPD